MGSPTCFLHFFAAVRESALAADLMTARNTPDDVALAANREWSEDPIQVSTSAKLARKLSST